MRLEALFPMEEWETADKLLAERCGEGLPLGHADGDFYERVRFAALKLSGGDLRQLERAVEIANIDWRDTLVAAGFGHSASIHREWFPARREETD